jgi:tetratricopeptide (TPR) repeat protein
MTVPEPLALELRKSRHHFLMAVAIGSAWGGAVMVAAWFTIQNFSSRGESSNAPAQNRPAQAASLPTDVKPANTPEVEPPVKVSPKPGSRVAWSNPYTELRLELVSASGVSKARQGEDVRVEPGAYKVRIFPKEGSWHVDGTTLRAEEGSQLEVSVTPSDAARFFVELGDRFDKATKSADAISAWERALELDQKYVKAHLRLGVILPLQHRYRDAREHLDVVLAAEPGNIQAREARELVDALEKER